MVVRLFICKNMDISIRLRYLNLGDEKMKWKQDLTSLNQTGLILLVGSTIFSAIGLIILYALDFILSIFISIVDFFRLFYYPTGSHLFLFNPSLTYLFLNLSCIILGTILILKDLKKEESQQ